MKILFLTDGITPYVTGGMQKHSVVLVKLLLQDNHEVTLVHCGHMGKASFSEDAHVLFSETEQKNLTLRHVPFLHKGPWPGHYIYENRVYSKLIYKSFKDQLDDFDFIYSQGFTGWAFTHHTFRSKLLVNFHGFEMFQTAPSFKVKLEHKLLRPFVKKICRHADYVYSFGGQIDPILKQLGVHSSRILDQSNGIESKWVKKDIKTHDTLNFVFIGRNERRKGVIELHDALRALRASGPLRFKMTFIGPIPPHIDLKSTEVKYLGEIKDQQRIQDELRQNDVLICPSHSEGMPTVILEAMANGLAIIGTDVGATAKMIKGNGILLDNSDHHGIVKSINNFVDGSLEDLNTMKNVSLNLVKSEFVWERISEKLIKDLEQILGNRD